MKLRATVFLRRNRAQFRERFLLGRSGREIERALQPDVFRNGRIDESVQVFEAHASSICATSSSFGPMWRLTKRA